MTASLAAIVAQARYKRGWRFWLYCGATTVIGAAHRPGTAGPSGGLLHRPPRWKAGPVD